MVDLPIPDPADGLLASEVGVWTEVEKHVRLRRYVDASRSARARFVGPGNAGAAYVDLFCGYGRCVVREDGRFIDGSPLVAHREAQRGGVGFTALHIADLEQAKVDAATQRLNKLQANVHPWVGPATETVHQVLGAISPAGLHIVLLDPFGLEQLPFTVIETLARGLQRVDLLMHVSLMDLQRNFRRYLESSDCGLDAFCPGWRDKVSDRMTEREARRRVLQLWVGKIRDLGLKVYENQIEAVRGGRNQPLYCLVFASHNPLAHKLWNAIRQVGRQRQLEL